MTTYTVKKGDTLSKIAKRFNTTVEKLQKSNPSLISDVNKISVGWVLNISTQTETPIRCEQCEVFKQALLDINKLESVRKFSSMMGE